VAVSTFVLPVKGGACWLLNLNWAAQGIILSKQEKAELDAFSQNFKVVGERY
jgi:hypothetical protein